jgi:MFS family permease
MGIASLAGGFSQVVQTIYLDLIGISPFLIGVVVSVSTVAGALRMVLFGILSDKIGRRKVVFAMFMTSVVYYLIYFLAQDYPFFLLAAIIGGIGSEGFGGFVEGALLAEKAGDHRRTVAFSTQYFVASIFAALGSFASGIPEAISQSFGFQILDSIRLVFAFQAILALVASILILFVQESSNMINHKEQRYLSKESRKKMTKFLFINIFDGFGIGMIVGFFSLWFYLRFGISIQTVGNIFAVSKIFETVTYLLGPPIAAKLGLIRTISIARLGGAVSVALMAFMPNYILASSMYILRNSSQHISLPLRASYTLAIFNPSERASAASISNLTNTAGWTSASALSGYIIENIGTTISPLVSAIFVGFASQLYYFFFRDVKTPEEQESAKR